jgi:PAS domain S-box-containing protein
MVSPPGYIMTSAKLFRMTAGKLGRGVILTLTLVASSALVGASIWPMLTARDRILDQAEVETTNLARAFAHHADRALAEASVAVDLLVPAEIRQARALDEVEVHNSLRQSLERSPHLTQAAIADASGAVLASSSRQPVGKISLADRNYFRFHRDNSGSSLYIDDPLVSRVSGRKIVSVSKRISTGDGRFAGVIVASLDLDHFTGLYREVALGEGGAIELVNDRGLVLAGSVTEIGARSSINALVAALRPSALVGAGRFDGSDGMARIGAAARVEAGPIFVSVARGQDYILRDWRGQVYWQSAALAGVMGIVALLGMAAHRDHRRLANADATQRHQLSLLDSINDSTKDAIVVVDRDRSTILYNPAAVAMFGTSSSDTPFADTQTFELREGDRPMPRDRHPISRALAGQVVDAVELTIRRAEQPDRLVVASARPLRDATADVDGGIMVCRDVTEYRATQLQLQQAQRLKAVGQLTGGVAHDFNNVLTVILGNLDMLATDVVLDDEQRETVGEVIRAAERGATITRSLLSFSRQQPLQPRSIDINALVFEAAKLLRPTLGEQVGITTLLEDNMPPVLVDPAQLQTAVLNLAINARDAMPGGGKLLIETGKVMIDESYASRHMEVRPGVYALLAVTDTGTGMTREVLDKVFEPFFTTKGPGRGTGLGLSMIYGFVRQSGGHVKLYSELGVGTTVKMYLPLSDIPAQVDGPAIMRPHGGDGQLILVVEDDPDVRSFVCGQLRSLNYRVIDAATGQEALDLLDQHDDVALLFTDVVLAGGMNGRQLADTIHLSRPDLPVLYTSGYTENAIVHHGRLDAGVRLLSKPYRLAALAEAVRDAISKPA